MLAGRMITCPHRFMAQYRPTPYATPGAHLHQISGANSEAGRCQCSSAPIWDRAARHTAPPMPATNPPATGYGIKRTRLADRKWPSKKQPVPVITALSTSATTTVINPVSPPVPTVEAIRAITTTIAGDSPEIAPRNPPSNAMIRQAAKFPNSTSPTPWETKGARGPEKMKAAKAISATSRFRPEVIPADSAGNAFGPRKSKRNSAPSP